MSRKNLLNIWNKDIPLEEKIGLALHLSSTLNEFDNKIVKHPDFPNISEDISLFDLYKYLDIKFSFTDLDSIDQETLFYIFSNFYSNQELKTELSLILFNENLTKDKYIDFFNYPNYKELMESSETLEDGYYKFKHIKCKFNEYENGKFLDPISNEDLQEDFTELNGRCYNDDTMISLINTSRKDPFTREDLPQYLLNKFNPIINLEGRNLTEMIEVSSKTLKLYVGFNKISNIIDFDPKNLEYLDLSNNKISSISGFNPKKIKDLSLFHNELSDILDFDTKNIEILVLTHNQIKNIIGFNPRKLKELILSRNEIKNIIGFDSNNIETLHLVTNKIKNIIGFDPKKLKNLSLDNNKINNIIDFNSKNIKYLSLSHNNIDELVGFDSNKIESLNLNNNNIKNFIGFDSKNIRYLSLGNNKIDKIIGFEPKNIEYISLIGNPLNRRDVELFIKQHPGLKIDF